MQQPLQQKSNKKIGYLLILTVVLIVALGLSTYINMSMQNNLAKQNQVLSQINQDLTQKMDNITSELRALNQSYNLLKSRLEPNISPVIETRLGIKLIDLIALEDNYLWMTGEIENKENVTIYNVRLNFTLFTTRGVSVQPLVVGTLQPHQVIELRTDIQTSTGKIINWSLDVTSSYTP